jgi:phenylacetate-CoA ligase
MVLEKINHLLNYIQTNSTFYKKSLPISCKISALIDIKKLPFTTKDDISMHNSDFLCVPKNKVRDFITTSGTIGDPISFYLTQNDLKRLGINERNSFKLCNIKKGNKVLLTTTLDKCFMAGLAYYLGSQELGIGIIRTGPGSLKYQWDMIERFKPEIIIAVPSFLLKMIRFAKDNNIDLSQCSLLKGICIGEPIRESNLQLNSLGKAISLDLNIKLYSTYASTEMMTAFTECDEGRGGHLQEDLLFVEVLDKNGIEVKDGDSGEVVITTLGVEAMPLLRYRTGDICTVYRAKCKCGRTSLRLGPVLGRKSQRLKVKGTTIFASAIIEAVYAFKHVENFAIEVSLDEFNSDKLCLFVADEFLQTSSLKELKDFLKSKLLFTPEICVVENRIINDKIGINKNRKINRFIDKR